MQSAFFFFNDTATTEIYTLSLHDALPISLGTDWATISSLATGFGTLVLALATFASVRSSKDRKSTRLNSSHSQISYAVFCLKKKKDRKRASPTAYCSAAFASTTCCAPMQF